MATYTMNVKTLHLGLNTPPSTFGIACAPLARVVKLFWRTAKGAYKVVIP